MKQQDLFVAEERGRAGMTAAALHAEQKTPGWGDLAYRALLEAAVTCGALFTIEDLRLRIGSDVPPPPDLRAWGHVVQRAIRAGKLIKTGVYAPRASGHGTPTMTYRCGGMP